MAIYSFGFCDCVDLWQGEVCLMYICMYVFVYEISQVNREWCIPKGNVSEPPLCSSYLLSATYIQNHNHICNKLLCSDLENLPLSLPVKIAY